MSCKSGRPVVLPQSVISILDKALNEVVPQLIPRDPVNSDGVKPGFNSIRTNPYHHADAEIVPTGDAPMAIFDGKAVLLFSSLRLIGLSSRR